MALRTPDHTLCPLLGGWSRPVGKERVNDLQTPKRHRMLKVFVFWQNIFTETVRRDDRGITATEYALMLAIIAVGLITILKTFTTALNGVFAGVEGLFP
jgi:Flp pilus assembly pilin Flp